MTREELKEHIKQLKLESDLEGTIFELIDNVKEVNAALLNGIADILDLQAEFYEKAGDILEEDAREYDSLDVELNFIEGDIKNRRIEEISQLQNEFTEGLEKTLEEMKGNQKEEEPSSPKPTTSLSETTAYLTPA